MSPPRPLLPKLEDDPSAPFPPTATALTRPAGLLAWGGGLEAERLLSAYRQGIFPWYSAGDPILWWSPNPRCVLFPQQVHLSRRTRRRFHSGAFRLEADSAFDDVIRACAGPRRDQPGTWITQEMQEAYGALHRAGYAHSVEVWRDSVLVGGIYGIALGRMFYGESMFSGEPDASKIALFALCQHLQARNFALLDCQVPNPHLMTMGAVEISRQDFEVRLHQLVAQPGLPGSWTGRLEVKQRW